MKQLLFILIILSGLLTFQNKEIVVQELDNTIFKQDNYWRGADGAATVTLDSGKILWLFSDTFIDQGGTGKRSNAKFMIRNSIAIQESNSLESKLSYYYKGTKKKPDDFFKLPGKNWFWTGHGIVVENKLVIFLMEETSKTTGLGFAAIGWYIAIIDNPGDSPDKWSINYHKGSNTFGVIVGSSAVLQDNEFVYAFGVKEPSGHETYLLRLPKTQLSNGDFSNLEWRINNDWKRDIQEEPKSASFFTSQTEFSVHYDPEKEKYVQIQTYGFGRASIGYRTADQLYGPWTEPVLFYTPELKDNKEFIYTANAHPEFEEDGLIVTYNINNFDSARLVNDEEIYYPKIIKVIWQ